LTWYLVDGMDGSGKSTVADELKRMLEARGRRVMMFTHPSGVTVPGKLSAKYLTKTGKVAAILSTGFYVMDALRSIASMRINRRKYDDVIFVRYIMAVAYMPEKHYEKLYRHREDPPDARGEDIRRHRCGDRDAAHPVPRREAGDVRDRRPAGGDPQEDAPPGR